MNSLKILIGLLGLIAYGSAKANSLMVNQVYISDGELYTDFAIANAYDYAGTATLFNVRDDTTNTRFLAFCAEQPIATSFNPEEYTYSLYINDDVQGLYDRFYANVLSSPEYAVAFQLALWHILGYIPTTAYQYPSASASLATNMVDTVYSATEAAPVLYQLGRWSNDDYQDVIQASAIPVPEPGSALLLFTTGFAVFFYRNRGNKNHQYQD